MFNDQQFIFTTCQVGAEKALKKEIQKEYSDFKFAFSRPGYVTFKNTGPKLPFDFQLKSIFARASGFSLGQRSRAQISDIPEFFEQAQKVSDGPIQFHLWERDFYPPGELPLGFQQGVLAQALKSEIEEKFPQFKGKINQASESGQGVLDLVLLEPDQFALGYHRHPQPASTCFIAEAGGRASIELPLTSPSRAYLKLEESLLWSRAPIQSGDIAVEIGSAPGGASDALLRHGIKVIGIDPAEMDPRILKNPNFMHIQRPVAQVLREELPSSIQWLLLDMNVEPRISLYSVDRLVSRMSDSLLGVLLTVKLNQWSFADQIPSMLEHVQAMGMTRVKAKQLASHRQEILIYGITRKGMARYKYVRKYKS